MPSFKSRQVAKRFGESDQQAQHETVDVTANGRPYVVLLSAREYQCLRRLDRQAQLVSKITGDLVHAIDGAEPSTKARQFDGELFDP